VKATSTSQKKGSLPTSFLKEAPALNKDEDLLLIERLREKGRRKRYARRHLHNLYDRRGEKKGRSKKKKKREVPVCAFKPHPVKRGEGGEEKEREGGKKKGEGSLFCDMKEKKKEKKKQKGEHGLHKSLWSPIHEEKKERRKEEDEEKEKVTMRSHASWLFGPSGGGGKRRGKGKEKKKTNAFTWEGEEKKKKSNDLPTSLQRMKKEADTRREGKGGEASL